MLSVVFEWVPLWSKGILRSMKIRSSTFKDVITSSLCAHKLTLKKNKQIFAKQNKKINGHARSAYTNTGTCKVDCYSEAYSEQDIMTQEPVSGVKIHHFMEI